MAIKKITCPHCGEVIKTDDGRCAAVTKSGTRCSRPSTHGDYCWQHNAS